MPHYFASFVLVAPVGHCNTYPLHVEHDDSLPCLILASPKQRWLLISWTQFTARGKPPPLSGRTGVFHLQVSLLLPSSHADLSLRCGLARDSCLSSPLRKRASWLECQPSPYALSPVMCVLESRVYLFKFDKVSWRMENLAPSPSSCSSSSLLWCLRLVPVLLALLSRAYNLVPK